MQLGSMHSRVSQRMFFFYSAFLAVKGFIGGLNFFIHLMEDALGALSRAYAGTGFGDDTADWEGGAVMQTIKAQNVFPLPL